MSIGQKKVMIGLAVFAVCASLLLLIVSAATNGVTVEPTELSGRIALEADDTAFSSDYIEFGSRSGGSSVLEGALKNAEVAKYRVTQPGYNRYYDTPSAQLPFNEGELIYNASPDPNNYQSLDQGAGNSWNGQFRTYCNFSHLSYDDPIVLPGKEGGAHLHMFYGNTAVDAFTTKDSIANKGGSSCSGSELNRSSYWMPAMFDSQNRVRLPNEFIVYYKAEGTNPKATGNYIPIPQGLQLIAKDPGATSPQSTGHNTGWKCQGGALEADSNRNPIIPVCQNNRLVLKISFPRCWDGASTTLGSTVYTENGGTQGPCPDSHPYVFPTIQIIAAWELAPGETTADWYIASDRAGGKNLPGGTSMHADWYGGWHEGVMNTWTTGCLDDQWNCQVDLLRGGNFIPTNGKVNALVLPKPLFPNYGKGPVILEKHSP